MGIHLANGHEHCGNCILKQCASTDGCQMVDCQYRCGVKFHECKLVDHAFICQNRKVPCVNSYYGCSLILPRSQLGVHIQNCPASVIQCTQEWGRNPLYSQERLRWVPFEQPNPCLVKGYLDVELALHDQKVINEITQERYKQGVARKFSERHDPNDKLSYGRAKHFQDEVKNAVIVSNHLPVLDKPLSSSAEDLKWKKLEENDVESSTELETDGSVHEDIPECPLLPDTRSGLGLNLNIEMLPKFGRHSYYYKVPCRQVLQRQEFASHFQNVHAEIHGGLGWIEQRCPMAQYGCPFVDYPLLPSNQESTVVFNQDLGVFGVKPVKTTDNTSEPWSLLCLPSELLEEICKWLDGFSLNNLKQTCRTLHHNVLHLVNKQGVVTAHWRKRVYEDGSTSWILDKKVCTVQKHIKHSICLLVRK
jgi:F-box protein 30